MKKLFLLFAIPLLAFVQVNALDTLRIVKVFEPDTVGIGSLSSMFIDSVGATDEGAVFCFYTKIDSTEKTIRTDIKGNVVDVTDAPAYTCYTVYNDDTLYIDIHGFILNAATGDTITSVGVPVGFAASSSGIYVFHFYPGKRTVPYYVEDILNHNTIWFFKVSGYSNKYSFCYGEGKVYITERNGAKEKLTSINVDGSNKKQFIVPVANISGIGVYGGSLYVYSETDIAVYRLELPEGTTAVSPNPTVAERTVYYNLLGEKTNSPSGLTIVVTRYNDGSIRTEKKLFR